MPDLRHKPAWRSRFSDLLRVGQSRDRIPVWGGRFSAPVYTGPEAHSASYAMGTGSLARGQSDRGGGGVDHPPHLAARLKNE